MIFRCQCGRLPSFSSRSALKKVKYSATPSETAALGWVFFSTPGGNLYLKIRIVARQACIGISYHMATAAQSSDSTKIAPLSNRGWMMVSQ